MTPNLNNIKEWGYQWREWLSEVYRVITFGEGAWNALTLQNSWVDFGGALETAGYKNHNGGIVYVKGTVKSGTATAGTVIATLPAGFRPLNDRVFAVRSSAAGGEARVKANGEITIEAGNNTYFSLDNIFFWAEQ